MTLLQEFPDTVGHVLFKAWLSHELSGINICPKIYMKLQRWVVHRSQSLNEDEVGSNTAFIALTNCASGKSRKASGTQGKNKTCPFHLISLS